MSVLLLFRLMKASSLEILERSQLPPSQARAIFQVMEAELSAREHTLATRTDLGSGLHDIDLKIETFRGEFRMEMQSLRGESRTEMQTLRGEFSTEMQSIRAELKSDIRDTVRWNFAFWVAQLAAMAAILKLVK